MGGLTIRIGLVDDHPLVLGGLEAALDAVEGFDVVARAGTIGEARALLAHDDLDVVLLDIRLSDGNALSLLGPDRVPPPAVLVLSSFTNTQYVSAAISLGAQGYLLKTAPIEDVTDAVRTVAGGGSWFSAAQLRAAGKGFVTLTARERQVVELVMTGCTNDEIAARLKVSPKTIEAHLSRLFERFDVVSRLELGLRAEREGWLDFEAR